MVKAYHRDYFKQLYQNYRAWVIDQDFYVLLDSDTFLQWIEKSMVLINIDLCHVNGFMFYTLEEDKVYITMLFGENTSIMESLYQTFENAMRERGLRHLWVHFFNPISLAWYPLKNIVHPCVQGVLLDSEVHSFYERQGFVQNSIQETYYLPLNHFTYHQDIADLKNLLLLKDIDITFYNVSIHEDLVGFTDKMDAPHWKKILLDNESSDEYLPLLVATKHHRVIGFAGPLKVETSGRGYFAGIGVVPSERGQKIGKVLFFELCIQLKIMGASYMTLFTGKDNPAKHIYREAGFEVVKTFVTLKKCLG